MSEDLEAVLRRVAAGELTPEQALSALGGTPPATPGTATAPTIGTGPATGEEPLTTIRLQTSYRSVQLIADPAVAQLHVVGTHAIHRVGSTLEISTTGPLDDDERDGDPGQSATAGRFAFSVLPRTIAWARSWREHQLIVRVNPALAVELDVTGTDVKLTGLTAGLRAHLVASSLKAEKLNCQFDVDALSSSLKLTAVPTGESRIYAESSSVRLTLSAGSDLTISASNRMSRLVLPDHPGSTLPFDSEASEVTIGDGRDRLRLEAVMSSVTVATQTWSEVPS